MMLITNLRVQGFRRCWILRLPQVISGIGIRRHSCDFHHPASFFQVLLRPHDAERVHVDWRLVPSLTLSPRTLTTDSPILETVVVCPAARITSVHMLVGYLLPPH